MTGTAESDNVGEVVSLLRLFEVANAFDVMDIRVPIQFRSGTAALLTTVVVAVQRRFTHLPPRSTVSDRSTFPLMMIRSDDIFREPLSMTGSRTKDAVFSILQPRGNHAHC